MTKKAPIRSSQGPGETPKFEYLRDSESGAEAHALHTLAPGIGPRFLARDERAIKAPSVQARKHQTSSKIQNLRDIESGASAFTKRLWRTSKRTHSRTLPPSSKALWRTRARGRKS